MTTTTTATASPVSATMPDRRPSYSASGLNTATTAPTMTTPTATPVTHPAGQGVPLGGVTASFIAGARARLRPTPTTAFRDSREHESKQSSVPYYQNYNREQDSMSTPAADSRDRTPSWLNARLNDQSGNGNGNGRQFPGTSHTNPQDVLRLRENAGKNGSGTSKYSASSLFRSESGASGRSQTPTRASEVEPEGAGSNANGRDSGFGSMKDLKDKIAAFENRPNQRQQ